MNTTRKVIRSLFLPLVALGGGIAAHYLTTTSTMRWPKAEAAGYLFTLVGGLWLAFAVVQLFTSVTPEVGCTVTFWARDGSTKIEGVILEIDGDEFVVDTPQGQYTLEEEHFMSVRNTSQTGPTRS